MNKNIIANDNDPNKRPELNKSKQQRLKSEDILQLPLKELMRFGYRSKDAENFGYPIFRE